MKIIGWRSPVVMLLASLLMAGVMYKFPHKDLAGSKEPYVFYILGPCYILFVLLTCKILVLTNRMIRVYSALTIFWGGNKHFLKSIEKIELRGQKFTEIDIYTHTDKEGYTGALSKKEVDQFKDYLRTADIPFDQFRSL
jgi:hypothetical protein